MGWDAIGPGLVPGVVEMEEDLEEAEAGFRMARRQGPVVVASSRPWL